MLMTHRTPDSIRVALFDVAGTLAEGNTWSHLVNYPEIDRLKRLRLLAWAYPAYIGQKLKLISQVDFRERWVIGMADMLTGWSRDAVWSLYEWIIDTHAVPKFYPEVIEQVEHHKANGAHIILVSNMFEGAVQMLAERVGADKGIGTTLVFDGDVCTGQINGHSCAGPHKITLSQEYLQRTGLEVDFATQVAAYADSWSDRFLLEQVAHPTAVIQISGCYLMLSSRIGR